MNLSSDFGVEFRLNRLFEVLHVLLDTFTPVLILEPKGLILQNLLLLSQIGFRLLLRRHSYLVSKSNNFHTQNNQNVKKF